MSHYDRVREFMERAGQELPPSPTVPDKKVIELRIKLIREEAEEAVQALKEGDLTDIANELADLSVVTIGAMLAFGLDPEIVLEIVDRANLRKFGPGHSFRDDGKLIKPPDFVGPKDDLRRLIYDF